MTQEPTPDGAGHHDIRGGWVVATAGFATLCLTAGIGFFVFPALKDAISIDMGWTHTQIDIGFLVWGLTGAALSPIAGMLVDRYGARPIMVFGTLCQFLATYLLARVTGLNQLYAIMALASLGNVCNTYIAAATVVAKWFEKNEGAALGLTLLGINAGGGVMVLIAGRFLQADVGWRGAYTFFAFLVLAALIPILLWMKEPAKSAKTGHPQDGEADDLTLKQSVMTRSFWGVSMGDTLAGAIYALIGAQLVSMLTITGLPDDRANLALSGLVFAFGAGTILFVIVADHVPLRPFMAAVYALPAFTMFLLFPHGALGLALAFALAYGLLCGGRQALFPLALTHSFGTAHLGAIYGLSNSLFLIGNGVGPIVAGVLLDTTGDPRIVYALCAALSLVSGLLILLLRNERRRRRSRGL
ncbi:MAG: MFS transporter [Candidatus Hydrogenedentes bacterium]|nr:MFS transporter [Candidatus Hydrogenedentota bacterium]